MNRIENGIGVMASSKSDEWETPQNLFDKLDSEFHFTLDPCCQAYNNKCLKYYTKKENGLEQSWAGETVFCNPPYGKAIGQWVKKCWEEFNENDVTIAMLIPSRTDTKWFHKYILGQATEIRFIQGRLKFVNRTFPSWRLDGNYKISPAPFPSMIVIYNPNKKNGTCCLTSY